MKSLGLPLGGVLLAANIAVLMLLTNYSDKVIIISSCAIFTTFLLIFASSIMDIKDAFKVSLPFLFVFNGLIEYILSFFVSSENVKGDIFLIAIIVLFLLQLSFLIIVNTFSRHG